MPPRLCTCCDQHHVTRDWYVINERGHKKRGKVECAQAHEDRIRREVRSISFSRLQREAEAA